MVAEHETDSMVSKLAALYAEKVLSAREIAEALSTEARPWTTRKVARMLRSKGIGFQLADRGEWHTTSAAFRDALPMVHDLVMQHLVSKL
jgi:hypothetical protein